MKKFKKILALLMTLTMALGMSATVFAAGDGAPTTSTANVEITGIGVNDAEFKVVQIIEADYNSTGEFTGSYKWVNGLDGVSGSVIPTAGTEGALSSVPDLTSENVQKWAVKATEEKTVTDASANNVKKVTMNLGVGTWIIVATPKTNVNAVYNPMIASVYYTKTDGSNTWTVTPGNLNAAGQWGLETTGAYTKSTDLSTETDKKIGTLNDDGTFTAGQVNGEIGSINDYQLTGIIPSYRSEYFHTVEGDQQLDRTVYFNLQDSQGTSGGLEYQSGLEVKVGGNTLDPTTGDKTNYTLTYYKGVDCTGEVTTEPAQAKSFKIAFNSSYIEGLAGAADTARKVVVNYKAKITSDAVQQVAENTYKLYYTRTPGQSQNEVENSTPIEKEEYTYTASINGTVKKVDSNNNNTLLSGAVFGLYRTYDEATKAVSNPYTEVVTEATGTDGMVKFGGLEFDKTYYIKETVAPSGYSLSDKVYSVKCTYTDTNKTDGVLTSYTVTIKDMTDATATDKVFNNVPYGGSSTVINDAFPIVNTTLASLPSTGGIGTTIFTVGGCAIMILAAALYFATRRKTVK